MTDKETLFDFPCSFPIKVMGTTSSTLTKIVLDIVKKYAPNTVESDIKIRPSKKGKYTAVTVTIVATSKDQLDSIYIELTACKEILMAL